MKRTHIIIIVCVAMLTQSGCSKAGVLSNALELENLRLVQTMGLDTDDLGIMLTASTGKSESDGGRILISRNGETLAKAMESVQDYVPDGRLYFSHTLFVVISEEMAKNGIDTVMDYMQREVNMRLDTALIVLKNGSVRELMDAYGDEEDITDSLESVKRDLEKRGDNHIFDFRETAISLSQRGTALICALRSSGAGSSVMSGEVESTALANGYGILKDARLVGYVDPGWDSIIVGIMHGFLGSALVCVPDGAGLASLECSSSSFKITPRWTPDGGLDHIDLSVKLGTAIVSLDNTDADTKDEAFLRSLEVQLENRVTEHLGSLLELQRELGADFLDFTTPLRISGGQRFYALGDDWIKTAVVNTSVECSIDRNYDITGTTNARTAGK